MMSGFSFSSWSTALASFFFFQAEDGIRGFHVTGVQTCALPIFVRCRDGTGVESDRKTGAELSSEAKDSRSSLRNGVSRETSLNVQVILRRAAGDAQGNVAREVEIAVAAGGNPRGRVACVAREVAIEPPYGVADARLAAGHGQASDFELLAVAVEQAVGVDAAVGEVAVELPAAHRAHDDAAGRSGVDGIADREVTIEDREVVWILGLVEHQRAGGDARKAGERVGQAAAVGDRAAWGADHDIR